MHHERRAEARAEGDLRLGAKPRRGAGDLARVPDMKWYIACSGVSREIGGMTPEASQVRKMMFDGCPPIFSSRALSMNCSG
jgi:hypothetical protein